MSIESVKTPENRDAWRGGKAIDEHLISIYGQSPEQILRPAMPGSLLVQTAVYKENDAKSKKNAWTYISYGNTEVDEKKSDVPEISGSGYELVIRVEGDEQTPPQWPTRLFEDLLNYSYDEGYAFSDNSIEEYDVDTGEAKVYGAVMFVPDEKISTFTGPNGSVRFLEVVPLTLEEYDALTKDEPQDDEYTKRAVILIQKKKAVRGPLLITSPKGD